MLPQHFHIGADLQIVTTKTAHILYDNDRDLVSFDFSNHLLKAGTVELRTRDTIVRKVDAVGKTVLFGVVLQYSLLIGDRVRFALKLVIVAQAFVERRIAFGFPRHNYHILS